MKAAFFELEPWEKDYVAERLPGFECRFIDRPLTAQNAGEAAGCDIVAVFVHSAVDKEAVAALPDLRYLTTMSTGFDHIDLDACKARGIPVSNVPAYGDNTVAEHAFALLLAISRKLVPSIDRTRRFDFSSEGLTGFDLKGKTIGIVGGGRIGMNAARIARGFQMEVLVHDVRKDPQLAKDMGFSYAELNDLLARSDIVSLHVPYNKFTHHLINKESIQHMRRGCVLINTARGGVVETEALIQALDEGIVAGAGLDVLEGECEIKEEKQLLTKHFQDTCDLKTLLQDHALMRHEQVIVTPHNAFNSREALRRIMDTTIANVKAFLEGRVENSVIK
jgi:D-lactate dehydrogenase